MKKVLWVVESKTQWGRGKPIVDLAIFEKRADAERELEFVDDENTKSTIAKYVRADVGEKKR